MRLIKKCRWIRTFLAAILIISMASQSTIAYAVETGTEDGGSITSMPNSSDGNLLSGEGWLISIQEVDNTATSVPSGSTESDISFDNAWLHDFPENYYNNTGIDVYSEPSWYAFIGNSNTSASTKYYVANPNGGNHSYEGIKNYKATSGSGNFSTSALLLENSEWYDDIIVGLQNYSLTSEYVIYAANHSSISLNAAISAFVGLWKNSGSVDDTINDFVYSSDDPWEQAVKYLDLLIIVNTMCNNAWNDYIQDYLEHLNEDSSDKFVAVVVAAVANCATSSKSDKALMTLPVYYKYKTGQGISSFTHWDGSGDWSNIQSSFNNSYPTTGWKMTNNNTNSIWWTEAEMATTVYPVGSDGSLGFCGYTYIAPSPIFDDPEKIINPPSSNSTSPSAVAADVLTPVFTVEVTTEDAYMQRDTSQPVTATVTIGMKQTGTVRQKIQQIYTALKNQGQSYTTVLEVFIERSFGDSGGTDATTVLDNNLNDFFNNYADQSGSGYPQAAMYRYESTSTDGLFDILDGIEQIQFEDQYLSLAGIAEGTPMTATYHVGVRMAIYAEGQDPTDYEHATYSWIFQGTGKTVCEGSGNNKCSNTFFVVANTGITTTQSAHDDAEWICPKGVQWYSSLRDGNIDALLSQRATKHESRLLRSDELPQSPPVFAIRIIWLKNSQISYLLIQASPSDVYVSLYASIQST